MLPKVENKQPQPPAIAASHHRISSSLGAGVKIALIPSHKQFEPIREKTIVNRSLSEMEKVLHGSLRPSMMGEIQPIRKSV